MVSQRFTDVTTVKRMLAELRQIGDEATKQQFEVMVADFEAIRREQLGPVEPLNPRQVLRELTTRRPATGRSGLEEVPSYLAYLQDPSRRLPGWAQYYDPIDDVDVWSDIDRADNGEDPDHPRSFAKLERGKQIQRALDFFDTHGLTISAALLMRSLPEAYTSKRGAQILDITGHLVSNPVFRVHRTAAFVVAMMTPDPEGKPGNSSSLLPGGHASRQVRHVCLVHAAVRRMFHQDHDIRKVYDQAMSELDDAVRRGESTVGGHLDEYHTVETPLSQSQLLGTLLTFTVVVFDVLDQLGVHYDDKDKEACFFLWSVVAAGLGLGDVASADGNDQEKALTNPEYYGETCSLLPITPQEGERLWAIIVDEEQGETAEGQVLTNALLQELSRTLPQSAKPAPAAMMRSLLGDEVADMLGVPIGGWGRFAYERFGGRRFVERRVRKRKAFGSLRRTVRTEVMSRLSRSAINGFMAINDPRVPDFDLPDQLAERWCMHRANGVDQFAPFHPDEDHESDSHVGPFRLRHEAD